MTQTVQIRTNDLLTVTSLVSVVLLSVHVADDIAHGFDTAGLVNFIAIAVLDGFLYATLMLRERLAGRIVMVLVAVFAVGMPLIYLRSPHINETAQASGGLFFIWTHWAIGVTGFFGIMLTVRGPWELQRAKKARESDSQTQPSQENAVIEIASCKSSRMHLCF